MIFFNFLMLCLMFFGTVYIDCAGVRSEEIFSNQSNAFEKDVRSNYWWEPKKYSSGNNISPSMEVVQQDVLEEFSHLGQKEKYKLFDDLQNQKSKKFSGLIESDTLSPIINDVNAIQRSMKTLNASLPIIRNKRTLNLLLHVIARSLGYRLLPMNMNIELLSAYSSSCKTLVPKPLPCVALPTSTPVPTVPSNQIVANTIKYPYRPSPQIPLLQFAPLPSGVTVPYPPLLQRPWEPKTIAQQPNPCAPTIKYPQSCTSLPPKGKPPSPKIPCTPTPKLTCSPSLSPSPNHAPPPPPLPCIAPPKPTCSPSMPPSPHHPSSPLLIPKEQPQHGLESSGESFVTHSNDSPVQIHIFNNAKKFLPASNSVYSGSQLQSATKTKELEEYERLDEYAREQNENDYKVSSPKIFENEFRSADGERPEDGPEKIKEELHGRLRDAEDDQVHEDENKSIRKQRFYGTRMIFEPTQKKKSQQKKINFINESNKEHELYTRNNMKSGVEQKFIKIGNPVIKQLNDYRNEQTTSSTALHKIWKRDLQDFDFIQKYKKIHGDATEDEYYKDENPPGRTTTSIKKIEVKKFFVNKSEDDPVEYHEKHEQIHDGKPHKIEDVSNQQHHPEEHEDGDGEAEERDNYRQYIHPEYEERLEIGKPLQEDLARKEEKEEEEEVELPPTTYERPSNGRGLQYVTKTITKYIAGSGGKENVRVVPIYKVIHVPPPLPPRPQPPMKVIHHHHHRIPVYPKIIVRKKDVKRRPAFIASLTHPGNVLLVTIRERSG